MTKKIQANDELNSSLLRNLAAQQKKTKKSADEEGKSERQSEGVDKINFGVSRNINSQLNPEVMAAERKEKVAKLKELVQSGNYKVSSEDIAAALNEEIFFEIISNSGEAVND